MSLHEEEDEEDDGRQDNAEDVQPAVHHVPGFHTMGKRVTFGHWIE